MASSIEVVQFHGDMLQAVRDGERVLVVVKRVCEALKICESRQRRKLAEKEWATTDIMSAVAEDGKIRELFCIGLDSLPMWLATIEAAKVGPESRPKLIAYQKECARVLRDHFFGRAPAPALEDVVRVVEPLVERVVTRVVGPILEQQSQHLLVLMRTVSEREARIEQRVTELEQGSRQTGAISAQTHNRVRSLVRRICEKEVLLKRWGSVKAAQRDVYRELGELCGWGGKAQKWSDLPAQWESPVMVALTRRLIDAERHADRLLTRQLDMFPAAGAKAN